ncbi:MAG: electron transfer flavoprotein subunit alpha/FixB family protein [Nitrolancea sp.]
MSNNVLIFTELGEDGDLRASTAELFGVGRSLADELGGSLVAAIFGDATEAPVAHVAELGADRVLTSSDPALSDITVDAHSRALDAAMDAADPAIVLLSGTTAGRDLAAYAAAKRGTAHLVDAVDVSLDADDVVVRRPVFQGKLQTEARASCNQVVFITIRSGSYSPPERESGRTVKAEPLAVQINPDDLRVKVVELLESKAGSANLEAADVVVIGGRGLGESDNFSLAERLAEAFDGAVGATRAVSDLGWRPHSDQVGQTGRTIAPKLYIGVGVSGAVQHTVGMRGSELVVAINRDPDAPIFKLADFGIVGDLFEIVPILTERVRQARS